MSPKTQPPEKLHPYLRLPPESSLILLTGTLGCSTTWLTTRFIGCTLAPFFGSGEVEQTPSAAAAAVEENAVVLVSWMRDEAFWRGECRRSMGIDLQRLSSTSTFAFIDGLAALASSPPPSNNPSLGLESIEQATTSAIDRLQGKGILLILDAPDTLLATSVTTPSALHHLILALRSRVHSTILTLSTDLPLVCASTVPSNLGSGNPLPTPLERDTASFLVQQAHAAKFVMGVRELETGAARDVSGVLRVTRGGDSFDEEREEGTEAVREMEALFLVGRDGGVKVFERGSAGG